MSNQINFLLHQAMQYLEAGNLGGAQLLLKQVIKNKSNNSEALRLYAITLAQQGNNELALEMIDKCIGIDKRNGFAFSNRGNIQSNLGMISEAINSYQKAIILKPNYAEAYGNLANAQQELYDYESAIDNYQKAIKLQGDNPQFHCNLGNCFWAMKRYDESSVAYLKAIQLDPNYADAKYFLGQLQLNRVNFSEGWAGNEWRWFSKGFDSHKLQTSKPEWNGQNLSGCLFIWAEQGMGDQIMYASMLREVGEYATSIIVSVDAKLLPLFKRSFPGYRFIARDITLPEDCYDAHIAIGSIGRFCRTNVEAFKAAPRIYLSPNPKILDRLKSDSLICNKNIVGISWKSNNKNVGSKKSMTLDSMLPILSLGANVNFINLQYGDVSEEKISIKNNLGVQIYDITGIDLYDDIDGVLSLIEICSVVITTSNSIAHLAGAIGKEVLLLAPFSAGKFWYWHDVDGVSLWYPSIRIFKQERQGDWSKPIQEAKTYLENRFEF